ncbi:hypothetical protein KIN20_005723, partial [Parelaphostrongylus tenuis]
MVHGAAHLTIYGFVDLIQSFSTERTIYFKFITKAVTFQEYDVLSNNTHTTWVREYYTKQASDRINRLSTSKLMLFGNIYNVIVPE